jgi:hypothetical protein
MIYRGCAMRFIRHFVALAFLLSVATAALAVDDIVAILKNPSAYDGRSVAVRGTVSQLRERISHRGNDYDTFKLCSSTCISVFMFGRPAVADGKTATVHGTFSAVKHTGGYTFYNEIEADAIH